jgi:hypothetical protein
MDSGGGSCAVADEHGGVVAIGSKIVFLNSGFEQVAVANTHTEIVRGVALATNGDFAASVGDDKQVLIWDRKKGVLLFQKVLGKKPTCVAFTTLSDTEQVLLVGDKTGDVIAFPVADISQKSRVLLGHTASIITALTMADDGKLLISADRDEKIRVSNFPQTASVNAYCLGHSEFISCLAVSKCSPVVFSGSGDGTIAAWNYQTGAKEASFDVKQLLGQDGDKSSGGGTSAAPAPVATEADEASAKAEKEEKEVPSSIVLVDERLVGEATEIVIAVTMQKYAVGGLLKYSGATKSFELLSQVDLPSTSASTMVVPLDAEHKLVCLILPAPHFMSCIRWSTAAFDAAAQSESNETGVRIANVLKGAFGGKQLVSSPPQFLIHTSPHADVGNTQDATGDGDAAKGAAGRAADDDESAGGYRKKRLKSDYWDRPLSANVKKGTRNST